MFLSTSRTFTLNNTGSLEAFLDEWESILIILKYLTVLKLLLLKVTETWIKGKGETVFKHLNSEKETLRKIMVSLKSKYCDWDAQRLGFWNVLNWFHWSIFISTYIGIKYNLIAFWYIQTFNIPDSVIVI